MTKEDLMEALSPIAEAMSGLAQRVEALEGAVEDVSDPDDTYTQDAIARAEVLVPGYKLPTMDAKPGSKAHRDTLKGLKASVLQQAFATKDGHEAIAPLVSSPRPDFSKMTADALDVVFRAASQRVADLNNQRSAPAFSFQSAGYTRDDKGNKKVLDGRDINDINRKYWGRDKQPGMSAGNSGRA